MNKTVTFFGGQTFIIHCSLAVPGARDSELKYAVLLKKQSVQEGHR